MIDPAIFEQLQAKIDEESTVRDVSAPLDRTASTYLPPRLAKNDVRKLTCYVARSFTRLSRRWRGEVGLSLSLITDLAQKICLRLHA